MTSKIPPGAVADILNVVERRIDRHDVTKREIPYVHVSTLINTSLYDTFCPREFTLKYLENTPSAGNIIPTKFQVLFAAGHALGDYAVNTFIKRSALHGKYAWGDWGCKCGHTRIIKSYKPDNAICNKCGQPAEHYLESDIRDEKIRVVGHADLLLMDEDGIIYVYEVKSVDRADIDFDTFDAPLGDHVLQASVYYWLLLAAGYKVHKYVRILYVDRSLSDIYRAKPFKEFSAMRISAARVKLLVGKAKRAYNGAKSGVLPKRICAEITESRANKCKVAVSCFSRKLTTGKRMQ